MRLKPRERTIVLEVVALRFNYKLSIINCFVLFPFFLIFHNPEILRYSERRSLLE